MSYMQIVALEPGSTEEAEPLMEFSNSYGGATVVWAAMYNYYNPNPQPYGYIRAGKEFWKMAKDEKIPFVHRCVFAMTFDNAYIAKKDYERAVNDIRKFMKDMPPDPANVDHWPAIIKALRRAACPAIGFYWTSVGDNPWHGDWDEDKEAYGPTNWSKAWDLYAEMDALLKGAR